MTLLSFCSSFDEEFDTSVSTEFSPHFLGNEFKVRENMRGNCVMGRPFIGKNNLHSKRLPLSDPGVTPGLVCMYMRITPSAIFFTFLTLFFNRSYELLEANRPPVSSKFLFCYELMTFDPLRTSVWAHRFTLFLPRRRKWWTFEPAVLYVRSRILKKRLSTWHWTTEEGR